MTEEWQTVLERARALFVDDPGSALALLDEEGDPGDPAVQVERGRALLALRRPREAVAASQEAVRLLPVWAYAWALLTEAQLATGDHISARRSVQRVLELEPATAAWHALAGRAAEARSDPFTAEAAYRHALLLSPDDPELTARLARVVHAQGQHREGDRLLDDALGKAPWLVPDPAAVRVRAWEGALVSGLVCGQGIGLLLRGVHVEPSTYDARSLLLVLSLVLLGLLAAAGSALHLLGRDRRTRRRLAPLRAPVRLTAVVVPGAAALGLVPWVLLGLLGPDQWDGGVGLLVSGAGLVALGRLPAFTARRRRRPAVPPPAPAPEQHLARPVGRHMVTEQDPTLGARGRRLAGRALFGVLVVQAAALYGAGWPVVLLVAVGWVVLDSLVVDGLWPPLFSRGRVAYAAAGGGRRAGPGPTVLHGLLRVALAPWLLLELVRRRTRVVVLPHDRLAGVRAVLVRSRTEYDAGRAYPDR